MVMARHRSPAGRLALAALGGFAVSAGAVRAQDGAVDCGEGPCAVVEVAPSFSNISLKARRDVSTPDPRTGRTTRTVADVVLMQPFKETAYGPPVTATGLGSIRSAQVRLTVTQAPTFDPDMPVENTRDPVLSTQLLAAVSHRRMPLGERPGGGRVDRFGYALGLAVSYRPDDRNSVAGRMKWGAAVEYRRQSLPHAIDGSPVKVDNVIIRGSISGGLVRVPLFQRGLGFDLSGGYDIERKVPGARLGLATQISSRPMIVLGIDGWVQGRDDDPRTRDKRWDWAPRLSLQF